MLFNSLPFLVFLAATFALYWSLSGHRKIQNWLILIASYFFYGSWDWRFLILIVISSIVDFVVGRAMPPTQGKRRKLLLAISLAVNLGMLGFFKYFNFFIESASQALTLIGLETSESSLNILLPVGISFYTFQTLSYTIDIYRKRFSPTKNWVEFFAFVGFFPQLVAGPIERACNLLPQFEKNRTFDSSLATSGLRLFLWGLFKKMVIADRLAVLVDALYADPSENNGVTAILAGVLFAYQIYCDFSGYSDMAIGTGRLLGFRLMRNFKTPFHSRSTTEFWQRWHISLSSWFKDYLYIPLGGNKVSVAKWTINIAITFTISGLWHGANITFILWGFLCSIPIILERLLGQVRPGAIVTFLLFSLMMIIFRSPDLGSAIVMYSQLADFTSIDFSILFNSVNHPFNVYYTLSLLLVFILTEYGLGTIDFDEALTRFPKAARWSIYYAIVLTIFLFGITDNAPQFIYFQF